MMSRLAFVAFVLALARPVHAHDLWLERQGGVLVLQQGHREGVHAGPREVPYEPSTVTATRCVDASGRDRSVTPGATYPMRFEGDCAVLLVATSSGYWTKTAWETKNVPKTGIAGVVKSWRSEETIKRVERWTAAAARPLSDRLEITPLSDPFALAAGDKFTLQVTLAGRPAGGVPVAYDGDVRGTTAADGTISLRIRRPGLQMISASAEAPLADGLADTVIRAAALNFELPAR